MFHRSKYAAEVILPFKRSPVESKQHLPRIWSEETFQIFEYGQAVKPTGDLVLQRAHPEDAALGKQSIERASKDAEDFDCEHRLLRGQAGYSSFNFGIKDQSTEDQQGSLQIHPVDMRL